MTAFSDNPRLSAVADKPSLSAVAVNPRAPENHSREQQPHLRATANLATKVIILLPEVIILLTRASDNPRAPDNPELQSILRLFGRGAMWHTCRPARVPPVDQLASLHPATPGCPQSRTTPGWPQTRSGISRRQVLPSRDCDRSARIVYHLLPSIVHRDRAVPLVGR